MKTRYLFAAVLSLSILLMSSAPVRAEEEGIEPELFFTETAYAPEQGEFGVWLQPGFYSDDEGDLTLVNISLEYGLTDNIMAELSYEGYKKLETDLPVPQTYSGGGDLEIGLSYAFGNPEDEDMHYAVGLEVTLPTGDDAVTEDVTVIEPYAAFTWDIGEGALHANISYGFIDSDSDTLLLEDEEDEAGVSVAYALPIGERFAVMAELSAESNEWLADGDETEAVFAPGLAWQISDNVQLGMSIPVGLTDDSADWGILVQVGTEMNFLGDDD